MVWKPSLLPRRAAPRHWTVDGRKLRGNEKQTVAWLHRSKLRCPVDDFGDLTMGDLTDGDLWHVWMVSWWSFWGIYGKFMMIYNNYDDLWHDDSWFIGDLWWFMPCLIMFVWFWMVWGPQLTYLIILVCTMYCTVSWVRQKHVVLLFSMPTIRWLCLK